MHRRLQRPRGGNIIAKQAHRISTSTLIRAPVIRRPRRFLTLTFSTQMQRAENCFRNVGQIFLVLLKANRSSSEQVSKKQHFWKEHSVEYRSGGFGGTSLGCYSHIPNQKVLLPFLQVGPHRMKRDPSPSKQGEGRGWSSGVR